MTDESLPKRFAGQVALVTGANDRGIGGAIARRLAREGAAIAVLGIEEPKRLFRRLEKSGSAVLWREGDVRDAPDVAAALEEIQARFGRLDVVVNNAGIDLAGPLETYEDDALRRLLDVNLLGTIQVSRAALPHLAQPGGVIVNIASVMGLAGNRQQSVYSASKAGIIGFTRSLAIELIPRGQRVVAVAPAMVLTPMTRAYLGNIAEQGLDATLERTDRAQQSHPLGVGLPEDVAHAVAFLASSEARWISGVALPLGWNPTYLQPIE